MYKGNLWKTNCQCRVVCAYVIKLNRKRSVPSWQWYKYMWANITVTMAHLCVLLESRTALEENRERTQWLNHGKLSVYPMIYELPAGRKQTTTKQCYRPHLHALPYCSISMCSILCTFLIKNWGWRTGISMVRVGYVCLGKKGTKLNIVLSEINQR